MTSQAAKIQARLEDLHFMAETGASLDEAAARLGLSPDSLERWMYRRANPDLITLLRSRNPNCISRTPQLV